MLFASCVQHAPALQHQLTSLQPLKEPTSVHHHQVPAPGAAALVNEEAREAMRKLDAKLIAYLAGEDMPAKAEPAEQSQLALESLQDSVDELVKERFREKQLQLFKSICSIKLQMEALTLEAEGTKRMELLQSEIRPIFTVECQLSHELIKNVPRYDMFHIMQFESEKFHSLTQCTRFGQEAQRDVKLCLDDVDVAKCATDAAEADEKQPNFGRIHFAVWWREPGTCLNEMLGMGVLELEELYSASLLEQCKRIAVKRRGIVLANLYLKISLQLQAGDNNAAAYAGAQPLSGVRETNGDKGGNNGGGESSQQPQQQQQQENQNSNSQAAANTTGAAGASAAPLHNRSNRNVEVESSSFAAETAKVRVLRGFLYINESRNLNINPQYIYFMRPFFAFWTDGVPPATVLDKNGNFDYQEQFNLINDEAFIRSLEREHLNIEVGQQKPEECIGNTYGMAKIPLHKFYIAYRSEAMTNHLCKGKLPVIAMDGWVPIVSPKGQNLGELKCLLAMGSEAQISNLKETRGFVAKIMYYTVSECCHFVQKSLVPTSMPTAIPRAPLQQKFFSFELDLLGATGLPLAQDPLGQPGCMLAPYPGYSVDVTGTVKWSPKEPPSSYVVFHAYSCQGSPMYEDGYYVSNIVEKSTQPQWRQRFRIIVSVDYLKNPLKNFALDVMRKRYQQPLAQSPSRDVMVGTAALDLISLLCDSTVSCELNIVNLEDKIRGVLHLRARWLKDLIKPQQDLSPVQEAAIGVPDVNGYLDVFKSVRGQTIENLRQAFKRKVDDPPTTQQAGIVSDAVPTAEAAPKSADGDLGQANKSKVNDEPPPKLAAVASDGVPTVEAVINQFESALDLTDPNLGQANKSQVNDEPSPKLAAVASNGVPTVDSIIDQFESALGPRDLHLSQAIKNKVNNAPPPPPQLAAVASDEVDSIIDQFESALDLTDLNLGQAIKNKFEELEKISQRLRTRLSDVTGEQLPSQFDICSLDNWQPFNESASFDSADAADVAEFERDINTAPSMSAALEIEEANKNMISTKQESADRPDE